MIPEFYYADFPRQFRLRKRERSSSYVTDDEDENGRKGHVRKERNYSKTASKCRRRFTSTIRGTKKNYSATTSDMALRSGWRPVIME